MHVTINGERHSPSGREEAKSLLASIEQTDDLEIWVSESNGSSLCALLNWQCGWLMFLRFEGDAGFSSRNPLMEQTEDPKEAFFLSNGQVDTYPSSWTMDRMMVFDALLEFVASGQRPSNVNWQDDT